MLCNCNAAKTKARLTQSSSWFWCEVMPSRAWSSLSSPALGDAGLTLDELTQRGALAYAKFGTSELLLGI